MLRIAVSPLVAAVALGLLNPGALDVEDDARAPLAQDDDAGSTDEAPASDDA